MSRNFSNMNVDRITGKLGMTVADLIEELEGKCQSAYVVFASNYGDYHRTEQALPVSNVEELDYNQYIDETAYSQSGLCIEEFDGDEDEEGVNNPPTNGEDLPVVILRT